MTKRIRQNRAAVEPEVAAVATGSGIPTGNPTGNPTAPETLFTDAAEAKRAWSEASGQ